MVHGKWLVEVVTNGTGITGFDWIWPDFSCIAGLLGIQYIYALRD